MLIAAVTATATIAVRRWPRAARKLTVTTPAPAVTRPGTTPALSEQAGTTRTTRIRPGRSDRTRPGRSGRSHSPPRSPRNAASEMNCRYHFALVLAIRRWVPKST
jgi:hypothetical protein